jgi:hypothetical protein
MARDVVPTGDTTVSGKRVPSAVQSGVQQIDLKRVVRLGALGAVTAIFIAMVGMIEAFAGRNIIQPYLTLSYTALLLVPLIFGYHAAKVTDPIEGVKQAPPGPRNALAGFVAGILTGVGAALLVVLTDSFDAAGEHHDLWSRADSRPGSFDRRGSRHWRRWRIPVADPQKVA